MRGDNASESRFHLITCLSIDKIRTRAIFALKEDMENDLNQRVQIIVVLTNYRKHKPEKKTNGYE